jgi:hypothetical protein
MIGRSLSILSVAALGVTACASEPAPSQHHPLRVLVKLAAPDTDASAIARRATEIAQTPVRYVAASSERWHALAIDCPPESACQQALQRLRAATMTYEQVSADARRRVDSP